MNSKSVPMAEPISLIDHGSTLESIHKDAVALEIDEKLVDKIIEKLRGKENEER